MTWTAFSRRGNAWRAGVSQNPRAKVGAAAVNQAPVNTVPGAQTVEQDSSVVITGISVADADAGGASIQIQVSVSHGALTLASTTGLTFSVGDGTSDASMTFTGTIANINTALASVTYVPTAAYAGSDTLSLTTNDLGNTGTGGAQSDTDTVAITVLAKLPVANLTVYYGMDQIVTAAMTDYGTKTLHSTLVGSPTVAAGSVGNAVTFNGSSQNATIPYDGSLDSGGFLSASQTVVCHFKCSAFFVFFSHRTTFGYYFAITTTGPHIQFRKLDSGTLIESDVGSTNFCDNAWHDAVFIYTQYATCEVYIDGVSQGTVDCSGLTAGTGGSNGADPLIAKLGASFWPGSLDEFAVFNVAFTSLQAQRVNALRLAGTSIKTHLALKDILEDTITINSVTVNSSGRYRGQDATTSSWIPTTGDTLPIASTGSDPTFATETTLQPPARTLVTFPDGKVYRASSSTTLDLTTEDLCIELVYTHVSESSKRLAAKRPSAGGVGWELVTLTGADRLRFSYSDGTTSVNANTGTLTAGTTYHVMVFIDRSQTGTNGAQIYVNGALSNSTSNSVVNSLTNSAKFAIGSDSDLAAKCTQSLAFLQIFKSSSWFAGGAQNGTDWLAISSARYNRLT